MHHLLNWIVLLGGVTTAACLLGCASPAKAAGDGKSGVSKQSFGTTPEGTPVYLYTLRNAHGMEARISTYGGIVVSLKVPDKNGHLGDVVLGYDNLAAYIKETPYFGALIGRYGNRIAK